MWQENRRGLNIPWCSRTGGVTPWKERLYGFMQTQILGSKFFAEVDGNRGLRVNDYVQNASGIWIPERDFMENFENPFCSKEGQMPVSITETFWVRLTRVGRPVTILKTKQHISDATTSTITLRAGKGRRLYIKTFSISCSKDADIGLKIDGEFCKHMTYAYDSSINSIGCWETMFCKAGTPLRLTYEDGEMWIEDGAYVNAWHKLEDGSNDGYVWIHAFGYETSIPDM